MEKGKCSSCTYKRRHNIGKKVIVLLVYFQFLEKCLKDIYIYIIPSTIFKVIGFLHLPNLVFFQEINVLPNYCQ